MNLLIGNKDKDGWTEEFRPEFAGRKSSRYLVCGMPHCGKTRAVRLLGTVMDFDRVIVVYGYKKSEEYTDFVHEKLYDIMDIPVDEFDHKGKRTLIILEDISFEDLGREREKILRNIMKYLCSHTGLTVYIICQTRRKIK